MKFYNFYAPVGYHFVIAYKWLGSITMAHIKYRDIHMPLGAINSHNGYKYNFNTAGAIGLNGCNYKGFNVLNDYSLLPKNFKTDFHDALVETMLEVKS